MENYTNEVNAVATEVHQTFEAALATSKASAQEGVWKDLNLVDEAEYARETDEKGLDELGLDMEKNGQLQNIILVPKANGHFECVVGTRRLRAAKKRGWKQIRADIKEGVTETQKLLMVIAENDERQAASPFYTSQLYNRIMEVERLSVEQLPEYLKKSRATVYDYLAIAKLPEEVKSMSERSDIGFRQLREIARLENPDAQVRLAQECVDKGYSLRELQARVKKVLNPASADAPAKEPKAVPDFQFKWKERELVFKIRAFRPDQESWVEYVNALENAYRNYVMAFPLPEAKPQEVAVAA